MLKSFSVLCSLLVVVAAIGCGDASHDTPVTPTVGTVATAQGTVMASGSYIPLAGAVVTIGGVTLTTGVDGTYAVSGLKPGNATLTAERQGFQRFSTSVFLEGARTFNIVLSPTALRSLGDR
jgi:Carboxypeptidase regulatory-like domain